MNGTEVLPLNFGLPQGADGPPGEVTAQVQEIANKVDEMLNVMKGS